MGIFGSGWWLHKELADLKLLLPTLSGEEKIACEKRIAELEAQQETDEE